MDMYEMDTITQMGGPGHPPPGQMMHPNGGPMMHPVPFAPGGLTPIYGSEAGSSLQGGSSHPMYLSPGPQLMHMGPSHPHLLHQQPHLMHHHQPSPSQSSLMTTAAMSSSGDPTYGTVVYTQPVILIDSVYTFDDRIIKMDYIRKVLGILFSQVGICFLIVNVFNLRSIKDWNEANSWFLVVVLVSTVVILLLLTCTADSLQDCPVNVMLTGLFTLTCSLSIGASSTLSVDSHFNLIYFYDATLFLSFALIFSLILYAFQTNYDFNIINCLKYIVLIVTVFIVIYLFLIIFWSYWLALILPTVAYSATCGLAFTLYIISDLTFMLNRSHYNGLTPKSVMLAVIYLHTDIVNPNGNLWRSC